MSSLIVEVVEIKDVQNHPGADCLDLVYIKGWQCVHSKGVFKIGDKAVYFPIDSILPKDIEEKLFPPDSKIKLFGSRVKTIKIRKAVSQGMLVKLLDLGLSEDTPIGTDLKDRLNISKYEPKEKSPNNFKISEGTIKNSNPNFHKYTDIENINNYPDLFKPEDVVIISEKVHGTSARAGIVEAVYTNWVHRLLAKFFKVYRYEFIFGSRNVQFRSKLLLLNRGRKPYEQNRDVYAEAVRNYKLEEIIPPGYMLFGEIYGDGIQAGYNYGCKSGEHKFVAYDIERESGLFLDYEDFTMFCKKRSIPYVPILYSGPYNSLQFILSQVDMKVSVLSTKQKIMEGIVIRSAKEEVCMVGRKILKYINPEYLLRKGNTDWH